MSGWGLFSIYLLGCFFAVACVVIKLTLAWLIDQLSGIRYYWLNAAKIGLYRSRLTGQVVEELPGPLVWVYVVTFNSAFSWITVAVAVFQIGIILIQFLGSLIHREPQELVSFRYPLISNPSLEPEAVWARMYGMAVKFSGIVPSVNSIVEDVRLTQKRVTYFDAVKAMENLTHLQVVDKSIVDEATKQLAALEALGKTANGRY